MFLSLEPQVAGFPGSLLHPGIAQTRHRPHTQLFLFNEKQTLPTLCLAGWFKSCCVTVTCPSISFLRKEKDNLIRAWSGSVLYLCPPPPFPRPGLHTDRQTDRAEVIMLSTVMLKLTPKDYGQVTLDFFFKAHFHKSWIAPRASLCLRVCGH